MTFVDARQLPGRTTLECDVLIVGAGSAGLTLAREFAGKHDHVIVLEAGGERMDRAGQRDFRGRYLGPLQGRPLSISRWRGLGGSTQRWAGQCGRMTQADFESRPWVENSGWPFGLDELEPYYARAENLLGLGPFDADQTVSSDEGGTSALVAHDFRFPDERNLATQLRDELAATDNVRVMTNATVVHIEMNANGNVADGVCFEDGSGQAVSVTGKHVVLAANGLENVRLLLHSNDVCGNGIGNDADNVGRYFMDHPYFSAAVFPLADATRLWPASTIDDYHDLFDRGEIKVIQFDNEWVQAQQLVNCGVMFVGRTRFKAHRAYLSPEVDRFHSLLELIGDGQVGDPESRRLAKRVIRDVFGIIGAYGRSLGKGQRQLDRATVRATVEPVPDRDSRVRLSEKSDRFGIPLADIDWRLGELERRSLLVMHDLLGREFEKQGVSLDVRLEPDPETGWPMPLQGGRHYIGTTRMHGAPQTGVVDTNCRVHGTENLYIAGSSVFPTASYVNPTLTIMALAIRLADHIGATR